MIKCADAVAIQCTGTAGAAFSRCCCSVKMLVGECGCCTGSVFLSSAWLVAQSLIVNGVDGYVFFKKNSKGADVVL